MSSFTVTILWQGAASDDFVRGRYSRRHEWQFDGGVRVPASSSPHVVPLPYSDATAVDPEEAFVASLSSCHMLFFLNLTSQAGFVVTSYRDDAIGEMTTTDGRTWVSKVVLRPTIEFGDGRRPTPSELDAFHHASHDLCFIANSVKTEVVCEPADAGPHTGH